jgi:hypothetical protein
MTVTKGNAPKPRADTTAPRARAGARAGSLAATPPVAPAATRTRVDAATVMKVVVLLIALVAAGAIAWLLVTSAGLGTFPAPAESASDAAKVGSFMIRFGLVIIALAAAVGLGAQILGLALGNQSMRSGTFDWVEFMKALAELIKTPAGMGFGVTILGVILMFPTVFASP